MCSAARGGGAIWTTTASLPQGADWLVEDGIVVVAAPGNSSPNPGTVFSPATGRYVIGVGAASDPSVGGSWSCAASLPGVHA